MNTLKIIKNALIDSILAIIYIVLVATLLTHSQQLFGKVSGALSGTAFLLTFVFSAAIMGTVLFGRPLLWYLDGFKKEAVKLVFYTLGFLLLAIIAVFLILLI